MERVIAIFLSCLLLSASDLLASSAEETYQAALTQEKGEGNLEEAIRLYQQVIEAHEKGEGDESMAARAQLRIGVCQEKLGLAQARQTYETVRDKYPDQPQVGEEAAQRLGSTHQREAVIEEPSHRTASESYIRRQLQQVMERAKRQMEAIQQQLTEQTKQRMEQAKRGTGADSVSIDEQVRRQLEAAQQQMEQAERQMEQQMEQAERQMEAIQRQGFSFERIRPRHFLEGGSDQQYYHYANTPPRIPYPHQTVAEVPMQWKFCLDVGGLDPQRHHEYANPDFDDSEWADISIGQAWENQGYVQYDEGAWYRTRIEVDAEKGRPVHLAFGGVDKDAYVYVNGHWVGEHHEWNRPFIFDISDHVVRDGENTVALYVYDGIGMGGVYGLIHVHQPIGNENLDHYLANRGGSAKRSFWSRFF